MALTAKRDIVAKHGSSEHDTGPPEVHIALLGHRRRMLDCLASIDVERYRSLIAGLDLRR